MRVILDTNVLISLSLGGGPTIKRIGAAWLSGELTLLLSKELLEEFARVAHRPHLVGRFESPDAIQEFVDDLRAAGELVAITESYPEAPDEADRFLLALARASAAEALVTGDKALLALGRFEDTLIISPRVFSERLGARF
jgi:putative PIN family toxin of toxin-antitoxin system